MSHRDPKISEAQIKRFAWKVLRRFRAAGDHSHDINDFVQELWIAWTVAVNNFNPELGIPFGAYLQRGMKFHINQYANKTLTARYDEVVAISLDASLNDEDMTIANILPDMSERQDVTCEKKNMLDLATRTLSRDAVTYIKIMLDGSEEIKREIDAIEQRNNYAASLKVRGMLCLGLSEGVVFELMNLSYSKRGDVLREIENFGTGFGND